MMRKPVAMIALLSVIAGCGSGDVTPGGEGVAISADSPFGSSNTAAFSVDGPTVPRRATISADGIGIVRAGMTVGDVRKAAHDSLRIGEINDRFMVDGEALPVIAVGDTLYHLLFPAGTTISDSTHIASVATMDEAVRTAEDVGPATLVSDAAAKYGLAVLQYNTSDESREYASFASKPTDTVSFRVDAGPGRDGLAGIYETHNEYNRTVRYRKDARIMMVIVNLR